MRISLPAPIYRRIDPRSFWIGLNNVTIAPRSPDATSKKIGKGLQVNEPYKTQIEALPKRVCFASASSARAGRLAVSDLRFFFKFASPPSEVPK